MYYAIVDAIKRRFADIAQVVERYIGNVEVTGPTPVISSFLLPSKVLDFTRLSGLFVTYDAHYSAGTRKMPMFGGE